MAEPYISTRNGKQYMYRATSHYSQEKRGPVAETEYMGQVVDGKLVPKRGYFYDEKTGEFGPIDGSMQASGAGGVKDTALTSKIFGDAYFLNALQKRLSLRDDLKTSFGPELGDRILAVAMAYTIMPCALMHIEEVIERRCILELLDLPADIDLSSPRLSELTAKIGDLDSAMESFFAKRLNAEDGLLIYDLTSETSYSTHNSLCEWGRNKDHLPAKQVNVGLVTNKDGRPVMFRLFSGSTADISTLNRLVEDMKRLKDGEDMTLVMDRGFVSVKSIYALFKKKMDFIAPMAIRDAPVFRSIINGIIASVESVKHKAIHNGKVYSLYTTHLGVRKCKDANKTMRQTVWEDPDGYELVGEGDEIYSSCEYYLDVFGFHDAEAAAEEVNGMDLALNGIMKDLNGTHPRKPAESFKRSAGKYASLLEWTMGEDGMQLSVKQNAHTFAANRKGIFIMIAPSDPERKWQSILDSYAVRDVIEDIFMEDKVKGDGRTPRSGDRNVINGRMLIRMIAMIMKVEMLKRISEVADDKKIKPADKPRNLSRRTPEDLLASLSNIERIYGKGWSHLTEITRDNRLVFKMFNIGPTKGLIEY